MNKYEEFLAFHFSLGRAVSQWAEVEGALGRIAGMEFGSHQYNRVVAGWLSIDNFRAKLQYVDTLLMRPNLSSTLRADWVRLVDRTQRAAKKRNSLAHHYCHTDENGKTGQRFILIPSRAYIKPKNPKARHPGSLYLRDIEA